MKRTNLVLDAAVVAEAQRLSGERTMSATVQRALEDFIRRVKARQILTLAGSAGWTGNLAEMRGDAPAKRRRSSRDSR